MTRKELSSNARTASAGVTARLSLAAIFVLISIAAVLMAGRYVDNVMWGFCGMWVVVLATPFAVVWAVRGNPKGSR